jgi:hypothetical protein
MTSSVRREDDGFKVPSNYIWKSMIDSYDLRNGHAPTHDVGQVISKHVQVN